LCTATQRPAVLPSFSSNPVENAADIWAAPVSMQ
jgi:hypothetical protein